MADISDIGTKFGIIYTCHCGWLDRAHSHPWSKRPDRGTASLWEKVANEKGPATWLDRSPAFIIEYTQDAGRTLAGVTVYPGVSRRYVVRRGLSNIDKQRVALAIFMEVSLSFEEKQNSWTARTLIRTDSGFSEEDLVSNLIGFYRALYPLIEVDRLCKPVSIQASREIWTRDGPVGAHKNRTFTPQFHRCDECKEAPAFPKQFQLLSPAPKGVLFRDLVPEKRFPPR